MLAKQTYKIAVMGCPVNSCGALQADNYHLTGAVVTEEYNVSNDTYQTKNRILAVDYIPMTVYHKTAFCRGACAGPDGGASIQMFTNSKSEAQGDGWSLCPTRNIALSSIFV